MSDSVRKTLLIDGGGWGSGRKFSFFSTTPTSEPVLMSIEVSGVDIKVFVSRADVADISAACLEFLSGGGDEAPPCP